IRPLPLRGGAEGGHDCHRDCRAAAQTRLGAVAFVQMVRDLDANAGVSKVGEAMPHGGDGGNGEAQRPAGRREGSGGKLSRAVIGRADAYPADAMRPEPYADVPVDCRHHCRTPVEDGVFAEEKQLSWRAAEQRVHSTSTNSALRPGSDSNTRCTPFTAPSAPATTSRCDTGQSTLT